jgi:hypothetical protein
MPNSVTDSSGEPPPNVAVERISLVAAYFGLCAVGAAFATVLAIIAIAFPELGWHEQTQPQLGTPGVAVTLLVLLTFALGNTYLQLRRRRRIGALLAGACLGATVVSSLWAHEYNWWILAQTLGVVLLIRAWRYLEPGP